MPMPDFSQELAEMLEEPGAVANGIFEPMHQPLPVRGWNEDDKQFPAVNGPGHRSTFPIKEKLKALGCKWSQQRNAWIAPTAAVHAQGERLANAFWAANPGHDPWTLEGAPQPAPAQHTKPKRQRVARSKPEVVITVDNELEGAAAQVSDAFTSVHMAQVLAKAADAQLVRELESRGYAVRKVSEAQLLQEALAAEGETGDHLLGTTDNIFEDLEALEEET